MMPLTVAGSCIGAGRHAGIGGWGWSCRCLTQKHHDAASLFRKPNRSGLWPDVHAGTSFGNAFFFKGVPE